MKGYARKLEKKLIANFMKTFYEKLGYYPKVITPGSLVRNKDGLKILELKQLEEYFEPYLPKIRNNHLMKLTSKNRSRRISDLRFMFFYIARSMKYSLSEIGQYIGKHHTTIIHGLDMFVNLYKQNEVFKSTYHDILNHIKNDNYEPSAVEHDY